MNPLKSIIHEIGDARNPELVDYLLASFLIVIGSMGGALLLWCALLFTVDGWPWSLLVLGFIGLVFGAGINQYLKDKYESKE